MQLFLIGLLATIASSLLCCLTIILSRRNKLGSDALSGAQKIHSHCVSRLGGVPVFVAFATSLLLWAALTASFKSDAAIFIACLLPAFVIGLIEDLTQRVGVSTRLLTTMFAAALGFWLLDAGLYRLDIHWLDSWLKYPVAAFALTLIAAAGLAHATNIIDGCNGLAAGVCCLVLSSLALMAAHVGDQFVMTCALLAAFSTLGFMFWNYPFGRIFLGDAGAYTLGFMIAELSILLVTRNPTVSPWFPMLLLIYPVWETLFSIWRRAARGLHYIGQPDSLHLHHLIHSRLVRVFGPAPEGKYKMLRNATTSPYLWALCALCCLPTLLWWQQTSVLMALCTLFIVTYIWLYLSLAQFRTPRLLILKRSAPLPLLAISAVSTPPGDPSA